MVASYCDGDAMDVRPRRWRWNPEWYGHGYVLQIVDGRSWIETPNGNPCSIEQAMERGWIIPIPDAPEPEQIGSFQ